MDRGGGGTGREGAGSGGEGEGSGERGGGKRGERGREEGRRGEGRGEREGEGSKERGREARREGEGSGDRGGGKRGLDTPLSTPTIFCASIARFVSDLFGNLIVGFVLMRHKCNPSKVHIDEKEQNIQLCLLDLGYQSTKAEPEGSVSYMLIQRFVSCYRLCPFTEQWKLSNLHLTIIFVKLK